MAKWIVLALVALTALNDAASDSPRKCSQGCKNAPVHDFKFNLQPGHTYVYNFEATTETSVPGAAVTGEDEKSGGDKAPGGQRVHISGQAELHAGTGCDHVMQLLHVQVTAADGKKFQDFASCERHPLGFNWNNGWLGDELCIEDGDTPVNVNVKRAILSLIQVSKVQSSGSVTLHETDIFGTCPTDFTYHEEGGVLKVTKRRNLNRCGHREGFRHTFHSAYYDGPSDFQSTPLLQSNLQVEQTIKDKVIVSAVGQENYLFRPFANGAAGARTTVTTRLTLVKHQPGPAPAVTNGHASPVLFDSHKWNYGGANPEDQASVEHVTKSLKAVEKSLSGGASTESAGLFRALVRVMRFANSECLMGAYSQVKAGAGFTNKKVAQAVFLDALLQTGTGQSIEAVVQLINAKDLSPEVSRLYYSGFSFIRHATLGSLKAVASLLESPSLPPEAYLGAGALVGRYCGEHQCDDSVPEFKILVGKLAHKLGKGCKPVSRVHENEIVGALKGLQNAKKMTAEAADAVMKCAVNTDVPTRVRVAALDAFRGDACHQKLKKTALEIMKNRELDSELRIKAYLAVTECPCETIANAVKEMMDDEPVYQVGSFVSSHLISLRTSSNPDNANAKHFLAGIRPKKRYPYDVTKFSRAYEMSYSLDGLNMATSAEGNVIFSQKSFVPRSANLNLTTSLFGHSFNLFEVGVRAENVDFVLESLLGPRGYFKTHSPNDVVNEFDNEFDHVLEHIKDRMQKTMGGKGKRVARHATREMINAVGKKVGHTVDHDDHSLDVDLHMKLFGAEVGWANYHGNLQNLAAKSMVDQFFDTVDSGINKAKDFKLDISPNVALLDTQLVYPTGAGFSLVLDATAYSSVDLKVESQIDVPALLKDPGNSKFHMKLLPSASVEVSGSMFVDAFSNVIAGLQVVGNVHSSTGLGVDVQVLEGGRGVEVKLGVPKPKQEIFNFNTQVMTVRREKGHAPVYTPLKFNRDRKSYHGCFEQLTPLTGLVFCGDVGFPWDGLSSAVLPKANQALFPLDGPVKASFHVEKESDALTYYYFRALYSEKGPHKKQFEIKFDTPNTKVDRTLQLSLETDCETDKVAKVNVKTPWVKFGLEGAAISNQKEHSLMGKYVSEGNEYMAKAGLVVKSASGNKKVYTPTLEVVYPDKKKLPGKGPRKQKGGAKGLSVEGTITIERDDAAHKYMYTFNGVNVVTPKGKFGVDGSIGRDDQHTYSTDMKLKYDDLNHYLAFKSKLHGNHPSKKEYDVKLDAAFTASQFPDVGFHLKMDYQMKPEHVDFTFDLVHGPDLNSDVAHLHLSNMYVFKHSPEGGYTISANNRVTYPLVGLEGKLQGELTHDHVKYDVEVKYDKHKVDSNLDFKFGKSLGEGYDFKWGVVALGTGFQLDSKRIVTSPKNSKFDVCLELKPGGRKYELESDLTHSYVGSKQFDFRANTVLKVPGHENYRVDGGAAVDSAGFKTHLEAHVGQVCHVNLRAHGELESNGYCKSAEWSALLLDHLQGSGHYSSDAKSNKGDFVINLLKAERKLKGEYSIVRPGDNTCKTLIDFYWNADKDPSKKLHIESISTGSKEGDTVESKSKIVFLDETTLVDFKVSAHGTYTAGNSLSVADIHLPSGRHISFKSQAALNFRPSSSGDSDGEATVSLCDKHSSGESCLKIHEKLTNFNLEKGSYVGSSETSFLRYDGKDLKFGIDLKILPKDEKTEISGKVFAEGSLLGPKVKPISVEWGGETMKGHYTYHVLGKVGQDQSLGVKGNLDTTLDGGKTSAGEFHVEAHTQIENLKHLSFGQKAKVTANSPANFDFTSSSDLKWGNDQKLTLGANINRNGHKGSASTTLCLPGHTEDHAIIVEWNHDVGTPRVEGSVAFMWPQGKKMKLELQATTPKDSLALHLIAHTPVQGHEKMELLINHRNIKAEHALETDVTLVASPEHKTSLHSRLEISQHKRVLDLSVAQQGGPTNKVHARLEKKGENHFESELKVDWSGQTLASESSLRLSGVDDFAIHAYLDSTALKVKKWSIDIASKEGGAKGAKGGKKIVFTAKKAEEVVFQGSTSFSRKQEGNAITYEGVGQVKMGDESRNANFKLFTKTLSAKENGESGVETKLNIAVTSNKGEKHNVVGEAKLSSKELRFYNSYCKGGSECSFVEAYSKVKFEDLHHDMDHEFAFILDLEKLTQLVPFSVKGNTHRSGDYNLDHKVEVQLSKGKSKYSYHLYLKEHEAGAVLVLPKRTMAAVGKLHGGQGTGAGEFGEIHGDISIWLDKERHPELKTSGSVLIDIKVHDGEVKYKSEAKLTHPSLGKDLAVRGQATIGAHHTWFDSKLEFDVFAKADQMVVMCVKLHHEGVPGGHNMTGLVDLKSKGQNIDVEWVTHAAYSKQSIGVGTFGTYLNSKKEREDTGVLFRASPEALYLLVKAPSHEILRADVKIDLSKAKQVITSEVCLFGKHTHVDTYEFRGLNSFKYSSHEKGSPNDQFQAHGTLVWGKGLEMHMDRLKGGKKEVLAHLTVALDQEHFFDIKHTWEQAHIKTYLSDVKNDYTFMVDEAKKMTEEICAHFQADGKAMLELLKKAAPNLKALLDSYKTQLNEFKEEILSDEYVHQVVVSVEKSTKALKEALSKTIDKLNHMNEEFVKVWNQYWEKVIAFYDKMVPVIRDSFEKIVAAFSQGFEKFSHYAVDFFEKVFEFMQQFSGEFKAVGKVIVQFIQDVARTLGKLFDEVKHRCEELRQVAAEHLKEMPAFEVIREYYEAFISNLPEAVYGVMTEVMATLKESAPTEELKEFLGALESYLKMKLFKTECDDQAELKKLYTLLVKAIKSLEEVVRAQGHEYPKDFSLSQLKIPFWSLGEPSQWTFSLNDISRLPFFFAVRASPFFYRLDDFPTPSELFLAYVPSLLRGTFPPHRAYGFLVGGEHFFTFDNRHYTLSGCVCDYVLAQDFEDGNFSIVAHFEQGKLLSITLMDAKEVVELSNDLKVKVNGQPTELPMHHGTVSASINFDVVTMKTAYGAEVSCDTRFKDVCYVSINGYYFGKTRGLLGTLNNEPYDDFIMPNGKIAPTVDKLANVWKADAKCGDVAAQTHVHEHVKQCSDMFAGYSSMRICFPVVNPAQFREACDAHVAMRNGDPCKFASAYAAACYYNGIKLRVPDQCAQCMIGGSPLDQGHSVSLKSPQGKADILLTVEQVPQNEPLFKELVIPLVVSLNTDLRAHKITDVKFVLIGYGGLHQKWPSVYTANGQMGFDGRGENVNFAAPKPSEDKLLPDDTPAEVKELIHRLERLNNIVNVEFSNVPYADAFYFAKQYPFRPGAAKAIISLVHSRCLYSPLPFSSQSARLFIQKKQYELAGISFHVLSPVTFSSSTRDKKQIRQIVGLDKSGVFSLGDAKKKFVDGDTEFRKDLSYDADVCVDFAQATNGGAYSTHNFAELPKPGFKKQFTQVVSQRVVQSLSPELTQDCTCQLYHGWHPVTRCRVTSRKESARLTTKTIKG